MNDRDVEGKLGGGAILSSHCEELGLYVSMLLKTCDQNIDVSPGMLLDSLSEMGGGSSFSLWSATVAWHNPARTSWQIDQVRE